MEAFRDETETLSAFDDFLNRAIKFMPHRPVPHLRYSLTHSLKQTAEGWTWKQDHRRREGGPTDLTDEQRKAANAARAEALWTDVKAINKPTMLFKGENSKILALDVAQATVAAMQNARSWSSRAPPTRAQRQPIDFRANSMASGSAAEAICSPQGEAGRCVTQPPY
jgi:hypothetical protein